MKKNKRVQVNKKTLLLKMKINEFNRKKVEADKNES